MTNNNMGWNLDNSYTKLPSSFYSKIGTNRVTKPKLEVFNDSLAEDLGLNIKDLKSHEGLSILTASKLAPGGCLIAQAYAGHQFGHFTMLGDGRALLIGEQINPKGERFDLHLKGSGRTPYSRGGDGLAPLSPMLREYLISEAMYGLGIPTSRSLAVISTGDKVYREEELDGAILTRVAKSHIRVGTFAYAANCSNKDELKTLADYTINRHFKDLKDTDNPYILLLKKVINLQANLIAKWQLVGFIHGVMNTDNMLISGETIDYGPCAFMDSYSPATVFSSIDRNGRYAYGNQPHIGGWNLARFAESLLPLLNEDEDKAMDIAQELLNDYPAIYEENWLDGMCLKLGILDRKKEDKGLAEDLLELMERYKSDFTNTFLGLTDCKYKSLDNSGLFKSQDFISWDKRWRSRDLSVETMKEHNPFIIPRNHLVEEALDYASRDGNYKKFNNLLELLKEPYNYRDIGKEYMMPQKNLDIPYRTFCGT